MQKKDLYLNKVSICKVSIADTFWTRFWGLMGKEEAQIHEMGGLLIKPCSQIHTFFMKVPIDVVYLNRDGVVVHIDENVQPSRCCRRVKNAKYLIEFPSGMVNKLGMKENSVLEV